MKFSSPFDVDSETPESDLLALRAIYNETKIISNVEMIDYSQKKVELKNAKQMTKFSQLTFLRSLGKRDRFGNIIFEGDTIRALVNDSFQEPIQVVYDKNTFSFKGKNSSGNLVNLSSDIDYEIISTSNKP